MYLNKSGDAYIVILIEDTFQEKTESPFSVWKVALRKLYITLAL